MLDYNEGDVDSSFDDTDRRKPRALKDRGLLRGVSIYTQTKNGTYLEINEGKAYVPSYSGTDQYVRSTSKKDSVDVISRIFQLDNNTSRFCSGNIPIVTVGGFPNPVEYCSVNCFTAATVSATCYDVAKNIIFIRSRIEDKSGRRWVTRTK